MVRALRRVRSVTARRQLRWIVWGTALGGAAVRLRLRAAVRRRARAAAAASNSRALLLGLIPLAFASAIVRYRLMDVEVIIKRALVYAAARRGDRGDLRRSCCRLAGAVFLRGADHAQPVIALLATLVVVLLSRPGEERDPDRRSTAPTTAIATTTAARSSASRAT